MGARGAFPMKNFILAFVVEPSMRALEKDDLEDDLQSSPGSSVNSGFTAVPSSPLSKSVAVSNVLVAF